MLVIVSALCVLVSVTVASPVQTVENTEGEWEHPDFCTVECPPFITYSTGQGYEKRHYGPTKWVSTAYTANNTAARNESKKAFWRLFRYIGGKNERDEKIPMTVPVITKVYPCSTDGCEARYTRSFYVPEAFHDDTPAPTEEGVYLESREPFTVFVKSFTGWKVKLQKHEENIAQLKAAVGDQAKTEFYYRLGFGPYRSETARNEGWLEEA